MSKILSSFLISLFLLSSCDDETKKAAPLIELESIVINQDSVANYKDSLNNMPVLRVGDEVYIKLFLNGNGSFLNALNIAFNDSSIVTTLIPLEDKGIFEDNNFTDLKNGRMRFVDGIMNYRVESRLRVISTAKEKIKLSFHLSARAECEEGGVWDLEFKTTD